MMTERLRAVPRGGSVVVAMIGARQHYEIARILHRQGRLACLLTDAWAGPMVRAACRGIPSRVGLHKEFLGRWHRDLPDALVRTFPLATALSLLARRQPEVAYTTYLLAGRLFARWAARQLASVPAETVLGFSSGSLELFQRAQRQGRWTVLDQIDPGPAEYELVAAEKLRFPELHSTEQAVPPAYVTRLREEWATADRIVVNSSWSRQCLVDGGVPRAKIATVPLAYDGPEVLPRVRPRVGNQRPLRVLWLGSLCLRKGLPYAVEAARLVQGEPIEFSFVGPSFVDLSALNLPSNSRYSGRASRVDVSSVYLDHDVLMLPTLSDGFGITQIEAHAHGLPVVVTAACGDVVIDGVTGFVVPPRDGQAIASALRRFLSADVLSAMRTAALARARDFTLERVGQHLVEMLAPGPQS